MLDVMPWLFRRQPPVETAVQLLDAKHRPRCGTLFIQVRCIRGTDVYNQAMIARRTPAAVLSPKK